MRRVKMRKRAAAAVGSSLLKKVKKAVREIDDISPDDTTRCLLHAVMEGEGEGVREGFANRYNRREEG